MSIISKERRKVYARKIKGFWEDFRRNRVGFAGLAIFSLYVTAGIFGPHMTPYDPAHPPSTGGATGVAAPFAMPMWMSILPQHRNLSRTMEFMVEDMEPVQSSSTVNITYEKGITLHYSSGGNLEKASVLLSTEFNYTYAPPPEFWFSYRFGAEVNPEYKVEWSVELFLRCEKPDRDWRYYFKKNGGGIVEATNGNSTYVSLKRESRTTTAANLTFRDSSLEGKKGLRQYLFGDELPDKPAQQLYDRWLDLDPVEYLFPAKNLPQKYWLYFLITFKPRTDDVTCTLTMRSGSFAIMGELHGLLGTNIMRSDVFAELIYGARISLIIGGLSALASTTLGIVFGVVAGYIGGIVDEAMMRTVDVLLCLPVLPLLLAMIQYYKPNIFFIVILIAIFGWQGLSRVIRSKVLSLREMPFVESARAAGASNFYLVFHHLIPNIIPVAMAAMVLAVPAAILTEAALSFIGFGDPNWTTWGRMLHDAQSTGAFQKLAWWYCIPPGLAITFLCVAFVFIGHAVDEIVNPRLRRRR